MNRAFFILLMAVFSFARAQENTLDQKLLYGPIVSCEEGSSRDLRVTSKNGIKLTIFAPLADIFEYERYFYTHDNPVAQETNAYFSFEVPPSEKEAKGFQAIFPGTLRYFSFQGGLGVRSYQKAAVYHLSYLETQPIKLKLKPIGPERTSSKLHFTYGTGREKVYKILNCEWKQP